MNVRQTTQPQIWNGAHMRTTSITENAMRASQQHGERIVFTKNESLI